MWVACLNSFMDWHEAETCCPRWAEPWSFDKEDCLARELYSQEQSGEGNSRLGHLSPPDFTAIILNLNFRSDTTTGKWMVIWLLFHQRATGRLGKSRFYVGLYSCASNLLQVSPFPFFYIPKPRGSATSSVGLSQNNGYTLRKIIWWMAVNHELIFWALC